MGKIQIIVECTMDQEKERLITMFGRVKYRIPLINSYVVEIPDDCIYKLRGLEGVKSVHENARITAQMNVARKVVNADKAQSLGILGRGVSIAVLDTGVAPVEDLILPRNRIIAFKDFINDIKESYDDNGHGTHVAYSSSHRFFM